MYIYCGIGDRMSKHKQYAKSFVISIVALLGLAGCNTRNIAAPIDSAPASSPSTSASPSGNVSLNADQAEDAVENALEANASLKAFDLDADEDNGSIALKGTVQNAGQKALAEEIAKRTAPGIPIKNQISVGASASASPSLNGKPPVDADEAEDRVSDAFKANTTLKPLNIEADEENGGILLKGIVQTAQQRTLAENIAKQTAPKFSINNQIRVVQ